MGGEKSGKITVRRILLRRVGERMSSRKTEDKTYIDLDTLVEIENKEAIKLARLLNEREEAEIAEVNAKAVKKAINGTLMEFLESMSADGLVSGDTVVDIVFNSGRGKWDSKYLSSVLTPKQMKSAYSVGDPYSYTKVVRGGKKAVEIRGLIR
jgi:hypothetical protein|tara:strand:- start:184 stop:642 length:459 start_codon:yes stop_codon:yes gene_type:complete